MEIADRCPVHRTLEGGARVVTGTLPPPPNAPAPPKSEPDAHFRDMEDECREADGSAA
jgi:putative redox protein